MDVEGALVDESQWRLLMEGNLLNYSMTPYPASAGMLSQVGEARGPGTLLGVGTGVGTGRSLLDHYYNLCLAATGLLPGVAAVNHDDDSGLVGKMFTHVAEAVQNAGDGR